MRCKVTLCRLLLICFLTGCDQPGKEAFPGREATALTVRTPSRLYFQNLRRVHYHQEDDARTRANRYVLRAWSESKEPPGLRCWIVDNWMHDQAFLHWRGDTSWPTPWLVRVDSDMETDTFQLDPAQQANAYAFTRQIVTTVQSGRELLLRIGEEEWAPVFSAEQRTWLLTTWRDYTRLTE